MKICIIANIYPPYDRGGAEQVVHKTVSGLLSRGHEVVVITTSPKGDEQEYHDRLSIYRKKPLNIFFYTQAHRYGPVFRLLWHVIDMFHIPMAWWVRSILRREKPDVVHTHNLMGLSFLTPWVIRRLQMFHVHTVHDVQLVEPSAMILKQEEHQWRYTGWPTCLYTAFMRRLLGSPHIVISPSQFLLDFYRQRHFFGESHCAVLRNPVMFTPISSASARESKKSFRFLYVGQIERHKGILLLLQTFLQCAKKYPEAELHIVGNGSLFDHVTQQAVGVPAVHVYGRLERDRLPALFQSMDVTVVPSLCYENSPTVIFESFAMGVPVLASRVEGIAELIEEGENGITFDTANAQSLMEQCVWCLTNRDAVVRMAQKTTESVTALSPEAYIDRLTSLYQSAVVKIMK